MAERLDSCRNLIRGRAVLAIPLLLGLIGTAMIAGDWWMRFRWFHWQDTWILRPSVIAEGTSGEVSAITNSIRRGGDLTRLVDIPSVVNRYEKSRPPAVIWSDEYGYRNTPPTKDRHYPVVVVGDSFMEQGVTMEDTFPALLSAVSGVPVYNHARAGWGGFNSIIQFMRSERFQEDPPEILVLGVVERAISGGFYEGLWAQLRSVNRIEPKARAVSGPEVSWAGLSAAELRKTLPNSSMIAQQASRVWNLARFYALGRINASVIQVDQQVVGESVLFYRPAIDAMTWAPEVRNVDEVSECLAYLRELCLRRGIELVVVLIPDKEQVYREYIPASCLPQDRPLPPSCLFDLEQALRKREIHVVNPLAAFQTKAKKGPLLFWSDDTHWNSIGMGVAVAETAPLVTRLLSAKVTGP